MAGRFSYSLYGYRIFPDLYIPIEENYGNIIGLREWFFVFAGFWGKDPSKQPTLDDALPRLKMLFEDRIPPGWNYSDPPYDK